MTLDEYELLKVGDIIEFKVSDMTYGYFIILYKDYNEICCYSLRKKIIENLWSFNRMTKI